ncbi:hypothetical protein [Stakelama tenebrarum]|uniref:Uncharacterized protein n=1 Tax=Stakelama tenebrarum TaxID=2711215 RepID=A0A6G6Y6I6_9SPHN|nr:hypothetical protein [Sphingosinithalassobacter tenebrarum]QIG80461.1 hypothetical protein G5C33_12180 [Sphingosinithalassobacter tenebrarum]
MSAEIKPISQSSTISSGTTPGIGDNWSRVAARGKGAAIIWRSGPEPELSKIGFRLCDDQGAPAGDIAFLTDTGNFGFPVLARLSDGRLAAAWSAADKIQACIILENGEVNVDTFTLPIPEGTAAYPGVAAGANGDIVFCWLQRLESESSVYACRYSATTGQCSDATRVAENVVSGSRPQIDSFTDGTAVLAWEQPGDDGNEIQLRIISSSQSLDKGTAITPSGNGCYAPNIACLSDQNLAVSWCSNRHTEGTDWWDTFTISAAKYDKNGKVVGSTIATDSGNTAVYDGASITDVGNGAYMLTWTAEIAPPETRTGMTVALVSSDNSFAILQQVLVKGHAILPRGTMLKPDAVILTWSQGIGGRTGQVRAQGFTVSLTDAGKTETLAMAD